MRPTPSASGSAPWFGRPTARVTRATAAGTSSPRGAQGGPARRSSPSPPRRSSSSHARPRAEGSLGDRRVTDARERLGKEAAMPPRGVPTGSKWERMYEHVKQSERGEGRSEERAEEIAARTVNKERARAGETREASRTSRR